MSKRNTIIRWSTSLNYRKIQAFTSLDKVLRENEIKLEFLGLELFIVMYKSYWFNWIKPGQTGLNWSTNWDRVFVFSERPLHPAVANRCDVDIEFVQVRAASSSRVAGPLQGASEIQRPQHLAPLNSRPSPLSSRAVSQSLSVAARLTSPRTTTNSFFLALIKPWLRHRLLQAATKLPLWRQCLHLRRLLHYGIPSKPCSQVLESRRRRALPWLESASPSFALKPSSQSPPMETSSIFARQVPGILIIYTFAPNS